ncbi:STAS-like domain-containing protein [Nevskia soli]|uniref:STAS-like domain-containing protein n=1 Tax=Nevskia soli TaxID=418856 RepID=UPI0009FE5935|nr:STAS-like domain-containing protein [Nevskia soli]
MSGSIERVDNRIIVSGELHDLHRLLAYIHIIVQKLGYQDVLLDLQHCTIAYQNSMLSVCAQVSAYREGGISFRLIAPTSQLLGNLFKNTNWGYFIDPHQFPPSTFKGHTRVPATQYRNPTEQQSAVNRIVNVILGAIPELERADFAAFEWAVNEITDNVLVHSESKIGGLVQVSTFVKFKKRVQFVVADAGVGIPTSLRGGHPEIQTDGEALDRAIREGVTRDPSVGQGNGLFGSFQICSKSMGDFLVDSGYARLKFDPNKGLHIQNQTVPYSGTLVVATVDFSDPKLLEEALRFKGIKYAPVDFVETKYTANAAGDIHFKLTEESLSFGSRVSGKPVQNKLLNLAKMCSGVVWIDFVDVPILSSSFADEAFGKLFLSLGPVRFMQKIRLHNMSDIVEGLVNKAIAQRMQTGMSDADS